MSTANQSTKSQEDELRRAGCKQVFRDVASGSHAQRPGLGELLTRARKGDLIVVSRLDRLGCSLRDLSETVRTLERGGCGFKSLAENIDSTTAGGKRLSRLLDTLVECERLLLRERTLAGLASARARGRVGGRPKNTDTRRQVTAASMLANSANSIADVCKRLGVSRSTAYRLARAGAKQVKQTPRTESTTAGRSSTLRQVVTKSKSRPVGVNNPKATQRAKRGQHLTKRK